MKISYLALSSAALILSSAAMADDESSENQTIIVTAQTARDAAIVDANKTSGGTDVISYEDYADKSLVSLRDVLLFSPGVYL